MVDAYSTVVKRRFGTSVRISAATSQSFSRERDKNLECDEPTKSSKRRSYLWPLVQKISVFCNARFLKPGIILVDLPGVGDTNKARDLVAKRYLQSSMFIWIVSGITRAVTDNAARGVYKFS